MASRIDIKYADLKSKGLDLGRATSAEQSAGFGGIYRTYEHGNIYWHAVMGDSAREVHGGILSIYLAHNGPGTTVPGGVIRDFGFPLSDESLMPGNQTPFSMFEFGSIFWTQLTGGVFMTGEVHKAYWKNAGELGLPISNQFSVSGGQTVFCERGVVYSHPNFLGSAIVGFLKPPLMGQPMIAEAGKANINIGDLIFWPTPSNDLTQKLTRVPPDVLSNVWNGRLVLTPVGGTNIGGIPVDATDMRDIAAVMRAGTGEIALVPGSVNLNSMTALDSGVTINLTAATPLADSTLYNLTLKPPVGRAYNLSPHCIYAKTSWHNFGLLHATDIHVSLRNEKMRGQFQALGLTDAAQHYSNCQDCFREFIRYANHLHSLGLVDGIIGTGDLVDYVAEPDDNPYAGNFIRLRRMILGEPFDAGSPAGEELRIPVFFTFGNHDYRLNRFDMNFSIDVDLVVWEKNVPMDEFSTFNITPDEAEAVQGGPIQYGLSDFDRALRMLQYDPAGGAYAYYTKYFSATRTFTVKLGANRLVLLDNSYDAGVPNIQGWEDLVKFLYQYETNGLSRAEDRAVNGCIDASGLTPNVLDAAKPALNEADVVVIVGMHVPPFAPVNSEFPYYLRETVHPTADAKLTRAYIQRNGFKSDGWSLSGTPFSKTGDMRHGQGLDNGVITQNPLEFLQLLAGVGVKRPVDLFLCGHHHQRTEYRIRWNGSALEYYMDFYTEEPASYYGTTTGFDLTIGNDTIPKGSRLDVRIEVGAPPTGRFSATHVHSGSLTETRGIVAVPPYPNPLDTASDAKQWWNEHRPIIAQTAALRPIDPRQRYDRQWRVRFEPEQVIGVSIPLPPKTFYVESKTAPKFTVPAGYKASVDEVMPKHPDPTFNGFRFIQVQGNVIRKVRYVTMQELRARNFQMPWEPGHRIIPIDPGVLTHELGRL